MKFPLKNGFTNKLPIAVNTIKTIALNTIKETLRQRILMVLVIFAVCMIFVSLFIGPFALGEEPRIVRDIGLATTSFIGIVIVLLVGSRLMYRDIKQRTIYTVLVRPVRKRDIVLGKFCGLALLVSCIECALFVIHLLVLFFHEGYLDFRLLTVLPYTLLEIYIILGVLFVFSSSSTPLLSTIMGIIAYLVGHAAPDIRFFAFHMDSGAAGILTRIVYYVLPNLEHLNLKLHIVHGLPLHSEHLVFAACYGIAYTVMLLLIAMLLFERREFT